jgi:putative PIN family toxin of toxin-antitoxin system
MTGLVLDTNVVVSAILHEESLQAQVVSFALGSQASLYISSAILEEYERVLRDPRLKFVPRQITAFLDAIRHSAIVVNPTMTITECPDESDNRFLECADAAGADFLVTGNKRYFPARWKGARIVNGREFIEFIASRSR